MLQTLRGHSAAVRAVTWQLPPQPALESFNAGILGPPISAAAADAPKCTVAVVVSGSDDGTTRSWVINTAALSQAADAAIATAADGVHDRADVAAEVAADVAADMSHYIIEHVGGSDAVLASDASIGSQADVDVADSQGTHGIGATSAIPPVRSAAPDVTSDKLDTDEAKAGRTRGAEPIVSSAVPPAGSGVLQGGQQQEPHLALRRVASLSAGMSAYVGQPPGDNVASPFDSSSTRSDSALPSDSLSACQAVSQPVIVSPRRLRCFSHVPAVPAGDESFSLAQGGSEHGGMVFTAGSLSRVSSGDSSSLRCGSATLSEGTLAALPESAFPSEGSPLAATAAAAPGRFRFAGSHVGHSLPSSPSNSSRAASAEPPWSYPEVRLGATIDDVAGKPPWSDVQPVISLDGGLLAELPSGTPKP